MEFDAVDNCRLFVTTKKPVKFQDDILSIFIGDFKNHGVLVFDLTQKQDATENWQFSEFFGKPLIL